MTGLFSDVRFAVRTLLRYPTFTLIAVATLALGIGANAAIFTIVRGVLLRPLDYPQSERLVQVWHTYDTLRESTNPRLQRIWDRMPLSYLNAVDLRADGTALAALGLYANHGVTWFDGAEPERLTAAATDAGLFETFGVPARLGRTFTEDEVERGANVVVLTDGYSPWPPDGPPGARVVVGLLGDTEAEAPPWAREVRIPAEEETHPGTRS